jgi:selenocysteine lyase/cysteine desulfurase
VDIKEIRRQVPVTRDLIYLNSGSFGPMATPVWDRYCSALYEWETQAYASFNRFLGVREEARARVAALLGARPEEIALTRNATEGVNLVLRGLPFAPGDEIVISDQENPALSFPALFLRQQGGPMIRMFRVDPDPAVTIANLQQALSPQTRLIAFTWVSCETGTRLPAGEICHIASERDIYSLVDAPQAVGQFPVNVGSLGCDFLAMCVHKWLFGPKGTGAFYIRASLLEQVHPSQVGMGSMVEAEVPPSWSLTLRPSAQRFEYGSRNFAAFQGVVAALDWLDGIGWPEVYAHMQDLTAYLKREAARVQGVRVQSPGMWTRASSLVNLAVTGVDPEKLEADLRREHRILCRATTAPLGVRISLAYFNTRAEIEQLLEALAAASASDR